MTLSIDLSTCQCVFITFLHVEVHSFVSETKGYLSLFPFFVLFFFRVLSPFMRILKVSTQGIFILELETAGTDQSAVFLVQISKFLTESLIIMGGLSGMMYIPKFLKIVLKRFLQRTFKVITA